MAASTRFLASSIRWFPLGVLLLATAGCGSSDRAAELAIAGAGVESSPEPGEVEGPSEPTETANPAAFGAGAAPTVAGSPPASPAISQPPEPMAGTAEAPRSRSNPLRSGGDGASGLRPFQLTPASVAKSDPGKEEEEEVPFDPIKENGEIFPGWSPPKLALAITGRQDGYLEPCGCAGLDRMKGGLSRRFSMFERLRDEWGWPLVSVDVGGMVQGFGPQADLKFQTTLNAMQAMNYNAIALGKTELQFSIGDLLFAGTGKESPFVSANAALLAFDAGLTEASRVVEAGGLKLGITSIVGSKWQREIHNDDVVLADPEEKLAEVLPALEKECDVLVLLAHATKDESIELAARFPQFDVVVTAGGPPEPPSDPEPVPGSKAIFVEVGEKGTNAVVLGFYDDAAEPIRYQRVPLDSRFPQSGYVKKLMGQYQEGLKELGLEGLGVNVVPYPGRELLGRFVGSKECESCHEESYLVWKKSGHAKAWPTLLAAEPPRNFDPECIACHVVGWSPQNYRPFESGYLSEEKTPHLVNVGCETCHGPGERHVKAEMGADFELQERLRKAAVITLEESQQAVSQAISDKQHCMNCHDLDNSPDFRFEEYWPKIEHREE